jgi:hypothetical protein
MLKMDGRIGSFMFFVSAFMGLIPSFTLSRFSYRLLFGELETGRTQVRTS